MADDPRAQLRALLAAKLRAHCPACAGVDAGGVEAQHIRQPEADYLADRLMELFPEVDEAYCTRYTDRHHGDADYAADTAEQARAAASRALPFVDATALRWLVVATEPEPIPTIEETP